jgi:hypothetical protein
MNTKVSLFITLALVAAATVACGLAPTPHATPTSTPTPASRSPLPTPGPAPDRYDGVWTGITSQGKAIEVTVEQNVVTEIGFGAVVTGSGWEATTQQSHPVSAPIADGQFRIHLDDRRYSGWEFEATGVFGDGRLEGALVVVHEHPQGFGTGMAGVTFAATREREV